MTAPRTVVVTGVGALTSHGLGLSPLFDALGRGEPLAAPIDRLPELAARAASARRAARVDGVAWDEWLARRAARRMSPPSIYGVVAARMAQADSGLEPGEEPDPEYAVVLATTYGACSYSQRMLDQILDHGPEGISPLLFMESVVNAPAGQVAIQCRAAGPNLSLCLREAGPVATVGRGAAEIAAGRASRALVGATEEMTPLLHGVLDQFRSLSDHPRPLDRRRDGFLAGEGALIMVLEEEAAARRRGARLRARVRAWGGAFDPTAPCADWGHDPVPLARSIRAGLARHELAVDDVDAVVCGASGSRRGDRLEAGVLRDLFSGRDLPPVYAPKGVTGEYAGAYLAAGFAALEGRPMAPPAGFGEPDPELGVTPSGLAGSAPPPAGRVLVTGSAAGGSAAWAVLERVDQP